MMMVVYHCLVKRTPLEKFLYCFTHARSHPQKVYWTRLIRRKSVSLRRQGIARCRRDPLPSLHGSEPHQAGG
jgi:hypothetical protein